ncbi:hypothetical protein JCGZ_18225 [Jatropha curcas]|uniref:Uncharacterized protein n=1 Tax=Jatropha curcas TaxID=180498 RepID=A0A067LLD4_JATCU|nr:hypothetical protein JCGZ_18225 [Jatropha curcas]
MTESDERTMAIKRMREWCEFEELKERESTASEESEFESEIDHGDNETEVSKDVMLDNEPSETPLLRKASKPKLKDEATENPSWGGIHSRAKSRNKKKKVKRVDISPNEKQNVPALEATAVDFSTFWQIHDHLDIRTQSSGYRPISSFGKTSFEMASKFIVEAALHGETGNLETTSAKICLGLPVKMGTGAF